MSIEHISTQDAPDSEAERGLLLDAVAGGAQIATQVIVGIDGPVLAGDVHARIVEGSNRCGLGGQKAPSVDAVADRLRKQAERGLTMKLGSEFAPLPEDDGTRLTAIAGYMGDLSIRMGLPPLTLMGGRGRADKKHGLSPALIRHRVNQTIQSEFGVGVEFSTEDLVEASGISDRAVAAHLKQLKLGQIVTASSLGCKKRYPVYSPVSARTADELDIELDQSTFRSRRRAMALHILQELREPQGRHLKGLSTADNLWAYFVETGVMSEYSESNTKDAQMKGIEQVLRWMQDNGFLKRAKNGSEMVRSYSLTSTGDRAVGEYLESTQAFVERDEATIEKGMIAARELLRRPHHIGWLMHSEHKHGMRSYRVEDADAFRVALQQLLKHPEGMTTHAIAEVVGKKPKNMATSLRKWASSGLIQIVDDTRRDRIWAL